MKDRDALTPTEHEEIMSAAKADMDLERELVLRRYVRAKEWLDDGNWTKASRSVWRRSFEGKKLTLHVSSDRANLSNPGTNHTDTFAGGFNFCFQIMYLTTEGFGPNVYKSLLKPPKKYAHLKRQKPVSVAKLQKLNVDRLTAQQRAWNEAIPPDRDTLMKMVRWDAYDQTLLVINVEREIVEVPIFDDFIEIGGETYACWRVASMLIFGNPDNYPIHPDHEKLFAEYPIGHGPFPDLKMSKPITLQQVEAIVDEMVEKGKKEKEARHEARRLEREKRWKESNERKKAKSRKHYAAKTAEIREKKEAWLEQQKAIVADQLERDRALANRAQVDATKGRKYE